MAAVLTHGAGTPEGEAVFMIESVCFFAGYVLRQIERFGTTFAVEEALEDLASTEALGELIKLGEKYINSPPDEHRREHDIGEQ